MPIYEYSCLKCDKVAERVFNATNFPETIECECGGQAKKILSKAAVFTDGKVKWMPSASAVLTRESEPPITSRTEYRAYLEKNNLEPKA